MQSFAGVLAAFGLSASAGLNAYIPMLIVSLLAKFTNLLDLAEPWDALTSWWTIGVLLFLSLVEFFADKIPVVDHINDIIQTFIRPTAGAILFAASAQTVTEVHPVLSIIAGLLVAGGVHAVKSLAIRPAVSVTTASAGDVPVSFLEDALATFLSVLAIVLPILMAVILLVIIGLVVWWIVRRSKRRQAML